MNKAETDALYKAKQRWLERVMASKLTHAQKTFAFCIFKRMYGVKLTSHPDTSQIMGDGGFSSSGHFTEYRRALSEGGAIKADLDYHTPKAKQKNYEYTLNLDWDGAVAPLGTAVAPTGKSHSTSGKCQSTTGASNTTNNTTRNNTRNNTSDVPEVADAPTVTFNKIELEEKFTYRLKPVSSSNQESVEPVYVVDLSGVTKSPAVAPGEVQQTDSNEAAPAPDRTPVDRDLARAAREWVDRAW